MTVDHNDSEAEATFDGLYRILCPGMPALVKHKFHRTRGWEMDKANVSLKVFVEVEGWGHKVASKYLDDIHKYNAAASEGWAMLRVTPAMLNDEPAQFFAQLQTLLKLRMKK